MPGNMKDGLQNTIVRDPFISDDVDQLFAGGLYAGKYLRMFS
jgi:hypothetical protein